MTQRKMMTIKEVAIETNLTEYAVRQFVAQGIFPHIRVGETAKAKILLDIAKVWEAIEQLQSNGGGVTAAAPEPSYSMRGILRQVWDSGKARPPQNSRGLQWF